MELRLCTSSRASHQEEASSGHTRLQIIHQSGHANPKSFLGFIPAVQSRRYSFSSELLISLQPLEHLETTLLPPPQGKLRCCPIRSRWPSTHCKTSRWPLLAAEEQVNLPQSQPLALPTGGHPGGLPWPHRSKFCCPICIHGPSAT